MARVKLMSALAFDPAAQPTDGGLDPSLHVRGELPASAQPFTIRRVYRGAQGIYEEVLALADPAGEVIWEAEPRRIELRGEMFDELFELAVQGAVPIGSAGEHTLLLYIDGELTGRVPVFVDAPGSVQAAGVLLDAAEVALKKGSICWLAIPQASGEVVQRPAWYVQQGQQLFVLTGPEEQLLPGIEAAATVGVTVKSKDVKAAIGTLKAAVRVVEDEAEFERIATLGLGTRLNLRDGDAALQRWKDTCTIVELTPTA